jgi:5'-3' exonuclease
MGIRKLNKFLTNKDCLKTYDNLETFKKTFGKDNIIIGIDFWLYTNKFLHSNKSSNIILGFWNQIIKFLSNNIIPVYIIDGDVPLEKEEEIKRRNNSKNNKINKLLDLKKQLNNTKLNNSDSDEEINKIKTNIEKLEKKTRKLKRSDLKNIKTLFTLLNIPFFKAKYEADHLCAKLYKEKIIDTCLSDDMDIIVIGCGSMIKFNNGRIIEYNLDHIFNKLDFDLNNLIDMSIILGCDYLKHPIKIDTIILYNLIKKHNNLFDIIESGDNKILSLNNPNINILGENYDYVKNMYISDNEILTDEMKNIKMKYINKNDIIQFFKKQEWFNVNYNSIQTIKNNIHKINKIFNLTRIF